MKAVVLAGGRGTRLSGVVGDRPKPMAPIGDKPFLSYLLTCLSDSGIDDVLLFTGYEGHQIEDYYGHGDALGLQLSYLQEETLLGTGGALLNAWDQLPDEFLVINGDTFFDIEYDLLLTHVESHSAMIVLRFSEDVNRYGMIDLEGDRITQFVEKGQLPLDRVDGFINGGIYYFEKQALEAFYDTWDHTPLSIEQDVFPALIQQNRLSGLPLGGKFIDIGIPADYSRAQQEIPDWLKQDRTAALFLDRDGILIQDTGYVHGQDLTFLDIAHDRIREANAKGEPVIVVTNQAGVARGYYDEAAVLDTNAYIQAELAKQNLYIDQFYYCPYHAEANSSVYRKSSLLRKPQPGMLLKAAEHYRIRLGTSEMLGDNDLTDRIQLPYLTSHIVDPVLV